MPEPRGSPPRPGRSPRKLRVGRPEAGSPSPQGEVFEDPPGRLVGTFYLPNHGPKELRYHVGRRTITLWSRKEDHVFQTILVLPRWVDPRTFILAHNNGVYEFHLEVASKPTYPSTPAL